YVVRRAVGPAPPGDSGAGDAVCSVGAAVTSCGDSGRAIGQTVSYAVFAVDAAGNVSGGTGASVTPQAATPPATDTTAPGRASRLRASVKLTHATVTWINPLDADFDHVQVVLNRTRRPKTLTDGRQLYRGRGTRVSFTGTRGTTARVAIYSFDHVGNV